MKLFELWITQQMHIIQLNTFDKVGGAALAAYRLHTGLRRLGQNSNMFVAERRAEDFEVLAFKPPMDFMDRVRRRLRRVLITRSFARYRKSRPEGYELFSDDRSQHGADLSEQLPLCDLINLHWIAGFVDYRSFFTQIPKRTPIVWTLHDMNAFTGGCHYDHGCGRYADKCGACPQLGSSDENDLSRQVWQRKNSVFSLVSPDRLYIVALNQWMAGEVKKSKLLGNFSVTIIPNGLDTEVFTPRNKQIARNAFEIPQNANIVLFVADSLTNRRKGFPLLAKVLENIEDESKLFLLSLGSGNPAIEVEIPHLHLGHIENERLLSLAYSAADIFVIPTLQDNLPNTVLESLACGTPVVGFDVGGMPDMVRPGITGMLALPQDVNALRTAIVQLLRNRENLITMAANCRRIAVEEYSLQVQARRYIELYEKILIDTQKNHQQLT